MRYEIKHLRLTCMACPSQWEGTLTDGRTFYIRYRYGLLSFRVSPEPSNDASDAVMARAVFHEQIGEEFDGVISFIGVQGVLSENGIILEEEQRK